MSEDKGPDGFWEEGCPTEAFLEWLKSARDHRRALALACEYFEYSGCGRVTKYVDDGPVERVAMSTGGWSGCEDVIHALEENKLFWLCHWYSVRRGGHYALDIKCIYQSALGKP